MNTNETIKIGQLMALLVIKHVNQITNNDNHVAMISLAYALCIQSITTKKIDASPSETRQAFLDIMSETYDQVTRAHESIK